MLPLPRSTSLLQRTTHQTTTLRDADGSQGTGNGNEQQEDHDDATIAALVIGGIALGAGIVAAVQYILRISRATGSMSTTPIISTQTAGDVGISLAKYTGIQPVAAPTGVTNNPHFYPNAPQSELPGTVKTVVIANTNL